MRFLGVPLLLVLVVCGALPARANDLFLERPVPGRVGELFDISVSRYSSGHRGVDLSASPGDPVRASAAGTVFFAGMVAGRPVLSVDHGGGVRTTYTPVTATVGRGDHVSTGDIVGTVATDAHCRSQCLHWGLTDGMDHFDPLSHLDSPTIRLLPAGSTPVPRTPAFSMGGGSPLPVKGRSSSHFGMRTHPITGVRKLHDGTDIAASCGTPVLTPWSGRVVSASMHSAYGFRVIVEHDGLRTAYAHLRALEVGVGEHLAAGSRVGSVGSTGLSTGCHLHWMAWLGGALIDPLTLLQ